MSDPAVTLRSLWNDANPIATESAAVPGSVKDAIVAAVNAKFKLFRYILPSQLLAKLTDRNRNALVLQARSTLPGSFDARSFCKHYITTFDEANHHVLGGSDDPGVGNIWRYPQIDDHWVGVGRRKSSGGRELQIVLSYAQEHPEAVEVLLRLTLVAIAERLKQTRIVYPRPNRISLSDCESLVSRFLSARTGGRRLQAVAAALFDSIGTQFRLFSDVEVGHINRSDAARGDVADLNCRGTDGKTVFSVEVKDRQLSVREVRDTLQVARDRGIAEIIYVIRGGVRSEEEAEYHELQERQFTAGHNIYDIEFASLLHACLIFFGEKGRLALLEAIGRRIDLDGELTDRQAWQHELHQV